MEKPNPTKVGSYGNFPLQVWKKQLQEYKNRSYILEGLTNKFRIGIDVKKVKTEKLSNKKARIPVDTKTGVAICEMLVKGVKKGFVSGPYTSRHYLPKYISHLHISPIFGIHQSNKIRPIHHLSFPKKSTVNSRSVNDMLDERWKTVQYTTFKEVLTMVATAGPGSYIGYADAKDAYYRLPIHPDDHGMMGIQWANHYWFFTCVQMGLSTGCYIYTQFADAIEHIIVKNNPATMYMRKIQMLRHYLDDFFCVHQDYDVALHNFYQIIYWFRRLGVPTTQQKCKLVK